MARAGDTLDSGAVRLTFLETSADTRGELLRVEAVYAPSSPPPPRHYHPSQDEEFEVLEGALAFVIDGRAHTVRAGETVRVPARAVHEARNAVDEPTRVIWTTRPALRTEQFFETIYGLVQDGLAAPNGRPGLLQSAAIAREFRPEFVLASPPLLVQTCVFGLLAPIARALGIRGNRARG